MMVRHNLIRPHHLPQPLTGSLRMIAPPARRPTVLSVLVTRGRGWRGPPLDAPRLRAIRGPGAARWRGNPVGGHPTPPPRWGPGRGRPPAPPNPPHPPRPPPPHRADAPP